MPKEYDSFEMRTAIIDNTFGIIEWGCFKFLAITTAVMAGNVYYGFFDSQGFSATTVYKLNIAAIFITYLIIDHGLAPLLKFVIREKGIKDDKKRKLVRLISMFVFIRILITATS